MKEIVIISGKGGTGKTSVTTSFAMLIKNSLYADCDVDAANMRILLEENIISSEDFYSGEIAKIDQTKCIKCGKCYNICRFEAISRKNNKFEVIPLNCEGCGYCSHVCPRDAIKMEIQNIGKLFTSSTKNGSYLVHAELIPGAENSGKLVAEVKKRGRQLAEEYKKDILLVDGSPGIGCPVISSLSGANFVVMVSEPTVAGVHDLKRVYELIDKFKIRAGCIINKYNLNNEKSTELEKFLKENNIPLLGKIPYDERIIDALKQKKTLLDTNIPSMKETINNIWHNIQKEI